MNNLAKMEQCNIKVIIYYYLLLDHLLLFFSRSITITIIVKLLLLPITIAHYYYPIPALNKFLYNRHDVVKTSLRHRQDITITPRRIADIFLSHAEGFPYTVADSKSTSLTVQRMMSYNWCRVKTKFT